MSLTAASPLAPRQEPCLVLSPIPWGQYEAVLEAFPEQAGLKITYVDRRMALSSPSYQHALFAESLADVVKAVASGLGLVWHQAGHATFRQARHEVGVEGDKTFYFGANAERMAGAREIDLADQPPPDLAIEVEVSHPADDAVKVWGRLGVPEVWRLDVNRWSLTFGLRQADGTYDSSSRSLGLSPLEPNDVLDQLKRAERLASSRWVGQLNDWVRDTLSPRRGG